MIILDFLFRNKPWLIKKSLTDDIFGKMWYNKDKDPEFNHYWIFRSKLTPYTENKLSILIKKICHSGGC